MGKLNEITTIDDRMRLFLLPYYSFHFEVSNYIH